MEGLSKILRYVLIILSILLTVFAIILIGIGIWLLVEFPSFNRIVDNPFVRSSVYIIIIVGIIMALVSILALVGAIKLNKILLILFVCAQLTLFTLEWIAAGFAFYVGTADAHTYLASQANNSLVQYIQEGDPVPLTWDDLHQNGECCAINGPDDFQYTPWYNPPTTEEFPDSCCVVDGNGDIKDITQCHNKVDTYYFKDGCLTSLEAFVTENLYAGIAIGIIVAIIQAVAIILSILLICIMTEEDLVTGLSCGKVDVERYEEDPKPPQKEEQQQEEQQEDDQQQQEDQDQQQQEEQGEQMELQQREEQQQQQEQQQDQEQQQQY
ncbi:tetraspanin-18B-like [Glandiceps talaboti]